MLRNDISATPSCYLLLLLLLSGTSVNSQHNSTSTTGCANPPCRKILCLHGGRQSGPSFMSMQGMADIVSAMGTRYEFVFLTAPYGSVTEALRLRDPPGGKGQPTIDRDWDKQSTQAIDAVVKAQGPFYGVLGYSQGTAATLSYLSHASAGTFEVAMVFCAYIPATHEGIVSRIAAGSPYSTPIYIYM